MNSKLLKLLKEQIKKIEELKQLPPWGPEYDIWDDITSRLVRDLFGEKYLELYKKQESEVFSSVNSEYTEELEVEK